METCLYFDWTRAVPISGNMRMHPDYVNYVSSPGPKAHNGWDYGIYPAIVCSCLWAWVSEISSHHIKKALKHLESEKYSEVVHYVNFV